MDCSVASSNGPLGSSVKSVPASSQRLTETSSLSNNDWHATVSKEVVPWMSWRTGISWRRKPSASCTWFNWVSSHATWPPSASVSLLPDSASASATSGCAAASAAAASAAAAEAAAVANPSVAAAAAASAAAATAANASAPAARRRSHTARSSAAAFLNFASASGNCPAGLPSDGWPL